MDGPSAVAAPVQLSLFDGFALRVGDTWVATPTGVQRLVALLALSGRSSRDRLAGRFWPDLDDPQAAAALRSTLWRAQRVHRGLVRPSGEALVLGDQVSVDVRTMQSDVNVLLRQPDGAVVDRLAAAEFWGPLLPNWDDAWVSVERDRLSQLQLHGLEELARQLLLRDRYGEALDAAWKAVRTEPLRESAHRVIATVHLAEGNRDEALHTYRTFRKLLHEALQVEPSDVFRRLVLMSHVDVREMLSVHPLS
jgi:DNA-binding SARP family transcriptional activator